MALPLKSIVIWLEKIDYVRNNTFIVSNSKTRYSTIGGLVFFLFGMILFIIGGRLIMYQFLLIAHGDEITGKIIDSGSVRGSSGGYVNYIRYQFKDDAGNLHTGQSSGYSGEPGATILLEYVPFFPIIHRISGEGQTKGYKWRWFIFGVGLLFSIAGIHWLLHTRARVRLGARLSHEGIMVKGIVHRITDNGRTITYLYTTNLGIFGGKTLPLPKTLVQEYREKDQVEVLYDPAFNKRSVLKIEL